jgi:hypothetical protein
MDATVPDKDLPLREDIRRRRSPERLGAVAGLLPPVHPLRHEQRVLGCRSFIIESTQLEQPRWEAHGKLTLGVPGLTDRKHRIRWNSRASRLCDQPINPATLNLQPSTRLAEKTRLWVSASSGHLCSKAYGRNVKLWRARRGSGKPLLTSLQVTRASAMTAGVPRMIPAARSRASSGVHAYWTEGTPRDQCLSDLRVERIEDRDRHPAPLRVPVLSNEVSVFEATGLPTLQRQDGCVQLLDPVEIPLLIDLLFYARVEVHRRNSDPREDRATRRAVRDGLSSVLERSRRSAVPSRRRGVPSRGSGMTPQRLLRATRGLGAAQN